MRDEIRKIQELMEAAQYVTDAPVATAVHLSMTLRKPLLVEGHAGVGKTEIAKVMSQMLATELIRLQCYEGLDAAAALYEWNYQKQLLHIKLAEGAHRGVAEQEHEIFSEPFLLRRPLLKAISHPTRPPVLLVDEIDRCVTGDTLLETARGVLRAEDVQPGDELASFDPARFRLTRAAVRKVIPHQAASVVRIFVGGRLLDVTPEHRFVRYGDSGYEVVEARDLRAGDRLPLHKTAPTPAGVAPDFEFPDNIVKLTAQGRQRLHEAYRRAGCTYRDLAVRAGVSSNHLRNVLQPHPFRGSLRERALQKVATALGIEAETLHHGGATRGLHVQPTPALYELLGYIVADGCFTSDRLCIADRDRSNLEIYAEKFREALGATPRIVPGPHKNHELTYHSLPLGRFLRRVLGRGLARSRNRVVPDFVFAAPEEKRAAFLRGYFDGEGWVADHQVCAGSASPYLLVGIQRLLSSLGVDGQISKVKTHPRSFGRGPNFVVTITDVPAFGRAVGFCSPAKARLLKDKCSPRFGRTETLPPERVDNVLRQLTRRVRPNVAALRRLAREFPEPALDELLGSGVVLGEVSSVEQIEGAQVVYDFVLDGTPYFVANQVITHNCDEEFEAFMLEIFAEWQVTIPEIGTIKAVHPPHVILTSNRTRELSDALRRRCLYIWIDYPTYEKEVRIVERKVPGIDKRLAGDIARFMESLRRMRLSKVPGVAETLDWAQALAVLHADHLDEAVVFETLGCLLKDADDMKKFRAEVAKSGLATFVPTH